MSDASSPDFSRIDLLEGLITNDIGRVLYNHAIAVPADQAIIELGSYHGKSTSYLAFAARLVGGQTIIAVDTWSEDHSEWRSAVTDSIPSPTLDKFNEQLTKVGLIDQVTTYEGTSTDAAADYAEALAQNEAPPVGLLYVDADHSYEAVMSDFEAWRPLMADDGVMLFDDYTPTNRGVVKALRELRDTGRIKPIATIARRLVSAHVGSEPDDAAA